MIKSQKYFSPLECGICNFRGKCRFKDHSEEFYRGGLKIPVNDCRKLQKDGRIDPKRKILTHF